MSRPARHACLKQLERSKPGTARAAPLAALPAAYQGPWICTTSPRVLRARWIRSTCTTAARCYSTRVRAAEPAVEDVTVACRSNGTITLNIHHPRVQAAAGAEDEGYGINDSAIVSALSAASHATIAQINYRSGPLSPYPTPVHDVLTGYDYVKSRFSQDLNPWTTTTRSGRVKKPHLRIGVCGQLVGGSLAAMLGLTESRIAQDRVAAVAAHAPLTDWVFPERVQTLEDALLGTGDGENDAILGKTARRKRKSKARLPSWEEFSDGDGGLSTCNLQVLREQLFKKPANYFDPFASPVHFFRSPSANVPGSPIDTASERETISEGEDPLSALSLSPPGKPRKAHRKFPPSNSTLLLPSFRLSTGTTTPLADMNEEFVKLLRRSVVRSVLARADTQALLDRFEEESLDRDERLELAVSEAERRVEYHVNEGGGLWGLGEKWRGEVEAVGRWFGGVLG